VPTWQGNRRVFPKERARWPLTFRRLAAGVLTPSGLLFTALELLFTALELRPPDGRALFTIGPDTAGEPLLTWLAIGYHDICP
jgi:hypothetical protein